jgi:hypothetical protein
MKQNCKSGTERSNNERKRKIKFNERQSWWGL